MTRWLWLAPAVLGAAIATLIMAVLPPDRHVGSLAEVLYKVSPLVCAVLAVAGFPRRPGLGLGLLCALVVGYMGVIDTVNVLHVFAYAEAADRTAAFPELYQFMIFMNAFTVLAALFAYRLGGADAARVLKAGFAGILVMISGLNDLSMWVLGDWPDGRPEVLTWASHIAVFVGGPPTVPVAVAFCAVHLLLAAVVLALPVRRWLDRLGARLERGAGGAGRAGGGPGRVRPAP
ncbi:hypothetical protein [Nonomuraea pusilla]|uniref:Uncharacterized protein n=1 Tax=Nonomuraea pusilla TaxID=46177 RepID=A0A1H8J5G1_9ACTN|nr:hypothetical protein [Nonomuraea pusilla]SEN75447.1 hypothetical protein SAMN05660976_08243 [Nonomuraea pusilla]